MTITTLTPEAFEAEVIPELESPELKVGDHVYQWRSLLGVPYMFQHHGIVLDIIYDEEGKPSRLTIADFSNVERKAKAKKNSKSISRSQSGDGLSSTKEESTESLGDLSVSEDEIIGPSSSETQPANLAKTNPSSTVKRSSSSSSRRLSLEQEGIVRTYTDTDKWHKVHYESGWWKRQISRSGTATDAKPDPVGLVLARVNYIMRHPEQLPDYHVLHANCECVAFWCKTGSWATLQGSSFLELTAAG